MPFSRCVVYRMHSCRTSDGSTVVQREGVSVQGLLVVHFSDKESQLW